MVIPETRGSRTPRRATAVLTVDHATTAVYRVRISVTCSIFPPWRRCQRSRTIFCGGLRATGSSLQILKVKSGPYFTPNLGTDNLLNGETAGYQRPNRMPDVNPYMDHK